MTNLNIQPPLSNSVNIETLPARTQFMIFTLFGDYLLHFNDWVWTSDLVYLLGLMKMSDKSVRSTLSRMTKKGWLATEKQGRRSRYKLTKRGIELLQRGQKRIFESIPQNWNGEWQLVVYSIPEKFRAARHTLRTQLIWLGFGSFSPGVWVSVHNRREELESTINSLDIAAFVEIFSSSHLGPSSPTELVNRCWELNGLNTQYAKFITNHQQSYQECLHDDCKSITPEQAFVKRFWLTHAFQSFPLKDPNLPVELLPEKWQGTNARELFDDYHTLLGYIANKFVQDVLTNEINK